MNEGMQEGPKGIVILDALVRCIGKLFSWLSILILAAIVIQVSLRYLFGISFVKLDELQWHFYGIMIMMALSYSLVTNSHIRMDLLHARFAPRTKAKVEIFGILFLLIPMIVITFLHSLGFVADSWRVNESSGSPMGLCCRWAFKAFMPIGIGFLGLAALSRLLGSLLFLKKCKEIPTHDSE